jgi:hypothetical protein
MEALETGVERSLPTAREPHENDALWVYTRMTSQHVEGAINVQYEV